MLCRIGSDALFKSGGRFLRSSQVQVGRGLAPAVFFAVQAAGIATGNSANMFLPKEPYTREQSIIAMIRLWNVLN